MRTSRRLSKAEFDRLLPHLSRLSVRNRQAAHEHFVLGTKKSDLAKQLGVTPQVIGACLKNVWEIFLDQVQCPSGWRTLTVSLPEAMAEVVEAMERNAKNQYRSNLSQSLATVRHDGDHIS